MENSLSSLIIQRSLPFCNAITLRHLCLLSQSARKIVTSSDMLNRLNCTNLTYSEVIQIISTDKNLLSLDCQFLLLTDTDLSKIVSPNLLEINLNGCQSITGKGLSDLAKFKLNLTRLELYWLISLTDRGFCQMIRQCTNLIYLNVSGCKRLTDTSLNTIIDNCPNLAHLVVK